MADAEHAGGELRGNGELLDLAWRPGTRTCRRRSGPVNSLRLC
ncbi:MAG TPA: hypothetical protein VK052_16020 [Zeimonas sp.]|nr:hypothetical protein [Zeimonas sp.]